MAGATSGRVLSLGEFSGVTLEYALRYSGAAVSGAGPKKMIFGGALGGGSALELTGRAPFHWMYGGVSAGYVGLYKIVGLTEDGGVVVGGRHVYLIPRDAPSLIIASAVSADDGSYSFLNIRAGKYLVWDYTPDASVDGVIHDNIDAVPM